MRIHLSSVFVEDQDKALRFYTEVLGFAKRTEIPLGEHRWLTVVSPDEPNGTELVLEPDDHPAVKPFKQALASDGIPFCSFDVDNVHEEASDSGLAACSSHRSRAKWDRSQPRSSTIPAET